MSNAWIGSMFADNAKTEELAAEVSSNAPGEKQQVVIWKGRAIKRSTIRKRNSKSARRSDNETTGGATD